MKIALVISNYDALGGGAERWTDRHARWLLARGHEVHLVAKSFRNPPDTASCHSVPKPAVAARQPRLHFAQAVEHMLRPMSLDAVVDMGDGYYADVFLPHHGTRQGGFQHNGLLLPRALRPLRNLTWNLLPRYREFAALERKQYELTGSKVFIALSHMVQQHMHQFYGVPLDRISIIPNGIDPQQFIPASDAGASKRQEIRQRLGFSDRTAVCLLMAHNPRLKGLPAVLHALALLLKQQQDVALVVAGQGSVGKYQSLARKLGCEAAVRFVGDQPDPLPWYHAADIYVQPTWYDPCSLVTIEALACGLPVLTSKFNGVGDWITPGVEGFVLEDPADWATLARQIGQLLDPALRAAASLAARSLALQHTFEHNGKALEACYEAAAKRRQPH